MSQQRNLICRHYLRGKCWFGWRCRYVHINPFEEQVPAGEISESDNKTCGICLDTVLRKPKAFERKFGILPDCPHCFCFSCIKRWRQSKEFEIEVSKSCPECRTASDFVYPSRKWYDNKEDKDTFIKQEKQRMKTIGCKYFRRGKGQCPFGNKCFYLHALISGIEVDVGPPKLRPTRKSERIQHLLFALLNEAEEEFDSDLDTYEYESESEYESYSDFEFI